MDYLSLLRSRREAHQSDLPEPKRPVAPAAPPQPSEPVEEDWGEEFSWSQGNPVRESADLTRILNLPRRAMPVGQEMDDLVEEMTQRFKRPEGTMRLKPLQAFALREAERTGGLLGFIAVGGGKTLLSFLLPFAFGVERAVLIVPAALKGKIFQLEYPRLVKHWRLPNLEGYTSHFPDVNCTLDVVTYHALQSKKQADVLTKRRPQAVICDEAHKCTNRKGPRGRTFYGYFKVAPETKLATLSGTYANRSIKDWAPHAKIALKNKAPVPLAFPTLEEWSWALDKHEFPAPPGALLKLCQPGEDARAGFGRRLRDTTGVVISTVTDWPCALNIHARHVQIPPEIDKTLRRLREEWKVDEDIRFDSALEFSRYARQLAAGMFYKRIWPRGEPVELRRRWLDARNAWAQICRETLENPRLPNDMASPARLFEAAASGRWGCPEWAPWADVKEQARPETEDVWLHDFLAEDAVQWGREHVGIIWVEHSALGRRIAKLGGFPFYAEGKDAARILEGEEDGTRTVVASRPAHFEGRNLQKAFHKNLITTPAASGRIWEQLLGRTHREGQPADEVDVWVYAHTPEVEGAVYSALEDARFIEETLKTPQRIRAATFTFNPQPPKKRKADDGDRVVDTE